MPYFLHNVEVVHDKPQNVKDVLCTLIHGHLRLTRKNFDLARKIDRLEKRLTKIENLKT